MLVYDLENNETKWQMAGKEVTLDTRPRSALHVKARGLIKERFPTLLVLEEVPIKTHRTKTLYLDFYLPLRKLVVEVHGQQHYKYSSQFHSTALEFLKQQKNDEEKILWCEINGIEILVLPYDTQKDWKEQL